MVTGIVMLIVLFVLISDEISFPEMFIGELTFCTEELLVMSEVHSAGAALLELFRLATKYL